MTSKIAHVGKEMKVFASFSDHYLVIQGILKAQNLVQLLAATKEAIQRMINADEVYFLFMNKDSIANYK